MASAMEGRMPPEPVDRMLAVLPRLTRPDNLASSSGEIDGFQISGLGFEDGRVCRSDKEREERSIDLFTGSCVEGLSTEFLSRSGRSRDSSSSSDMSSLTQGST